MKLVNTESGPKHDTIMIRAWPSLVELVCLYRNSYCSYSCTSRHHCWFRIYPLQSHKHRSTRWDLSRLKSEVPFLLRQQGLDSDKFLNTNEVSAQDSRFLPNCSTMVYAKLICLMKPKGQRFGEVFPFSGNTKKDPFGSTWLFGSFGLVGDVWLRYISRCLSYRLFPWMPRYRTPWDARLKVTYTVHALGWYTSVHTCLCLQVLFPNHLSSTILTSLTHWSVMLVLFYSN